ncbi:hypothetical protein Scep_001648 [Stephania cephalantha]|uniref:Uncharacterized protein n=1 Tax=Stephania cephalantha TaxID=152367 RepID=A0AAP0L9T4_9MAGN
MKELEGNEEDSLIGHEFFNTSDDGGGNVPDDSYEYMKEKDKSSVDGADEEDNDDVIEFYLEQTKEFHEEHNLEDQHKQVEKELEVLDPTTLARGKQKDEGDGKAIGGTEDVGEVIELSHGVEAPNEGDQKCSGIGSTVLHRIFAATTHGEYTSNVAKLTGNERASS